MASADFSRRIPRPCSRGSLIVRHDWRSPRVRRNPFPRLPPDLPMSHPSGYWASLSMARLPCDHRPSIRFLFVGSGFCLQLPPDPASRQRPCLQLTVPTTTACSGLAPYRVTPCLAHQIRPSLNEEARPIHAWDSGYDDPISNFVSWARVALITNCRPCGITGTAKAVINEAFYFVGFGFQILRHHIVHQSVSMSLQKHGFTCRTVTLFAEVG